MIKFNKHDVTNTVLCNDNDVPNSEAFSSQQLRMISNSLNFDYVTVTLASKALLLLTVSFF